MRGYRDSDGTIHGRQLFDGQHIVDVTQACSAVFWRKDDAQQSHGAELLHYRHRELTGFIPCHHIGSDFARGKLADLAAKMFLVFRQDEWIKALC